MRRRNPSPRPVLLSRSVLCAALLVCAPAADAQQDLTPAEAAARQAREAKKEADQAKQRAAQAEQRALRQEQELKRRDEEARQKEEENRRLKAELDRMKKAQVAPPPRQRQSYEPEMIRIVGGTFTMGSETTEAGRDGDEGPTREVRVKGYELGKYEVTQGQWKAVMGSNPSHFNNCGDDCPVERVSWDDVQRYLQELNRKLGLSGAGAYRLPSEAEWEYGARAGCSSAFNVAGQCRDRIEASEANFDGNYTYNGSVKGEYRARTLAVGSFAANSWGLHDMHGNVWEWVQDCYEQDYRRGQPTDGSAHRGEDSACSHRVLRGGSWNLIPLNLRSAYRDWFTPGSRVDDYGFRLARTVP